VYPEKITHIKSINKLEVYKRIIRQFLLLLKVTWKRKKRGTRKDTKSRQSYT